MNRKTLLATGLMASVVLAAAGVATAAETEPKRIAFFVSDLSNVFHQAQAAEAQRYAQEKYGAEVVVFDGQADSAVMTQNIDQVNAGGFDAATLHIWDAEAATPGVNDALDAGVIMTSFFSPIADTGIPTARSDEAGVSFEMGAQMATAWKEAHPDKPIVMVQLGWPEPHRGQLRANRPVRRGRPVRRPDGREPRRPGRQRRTGSRQADHRRPADAATRGQPHLLRGLQPDGRHDGRPVTARPRHRSRTASR